MASGGPRAAAKIVVTDVSAKLAHRVRLLSTGNGRKRDLTEELEIVPWRQQFQFFLAREC